MIRSSNYLAVFTMIISSLTMVLIGHAADPFGNGTIKTPTMVSGGTGTAVNLQTDNDVSYTVAQGATASIGGFGTHGGAISSVYLFVQYSVESGYSGTNAIRVNGVNTTIVPALRDYGRWAYVDITGGSFGIDTSAEISTLSITFNNNDGGTSNAVLMDCAYVVVNPQTAIPTPPTWSEDFNGTGQANPMVWNYEVGYRRNNEAQYYVAGSSNGWQEGGNFIIEGRKEVRVDPVKGTMNYTSASIVTNDKYYWKFGRAQIRAKIPAKAGMWPAIWGTGELGQWPHCGEVDILEYYGEKILANVAVGSASEWSAKWDGANRSMTSLLAIDSNWRNEWHVWTMQWDDQNIRIYVDNLLVNTIPQTWMVNSAGYNPSWGPQYPFQSNGMTCWLNLAMGGGAGGDPTATMNSGSQRYLIDYWKVWEGLTENNAPTDIALASNTVPAGLPRGTVVGSLSATDVDAAEVHSFSLVGGAGSTHNSQFEVVFKSDQPKNSVLKTTAVLDSADGTTRNIRVRVTDIEGATYEKVLTLQIEDQFVVEVSPGSLSVPEGGTNTFGVRLRVAPTQSITVDISRLNGDTDLSVTYPGQLTFTPTNGTTWQTVTLAAAEDDDRTNGTATIWCNDASGAFTSATVTANEADNEPPPIQALVSLTNLNQSFDGFAKTVGVATTPAGISHELTYEGQFMPPTDAGSYDVVATINNPDYIGSASGLLVVAKASQNISFAALSPVLDNAAPFALTGTSNLGLAITYISSNTAVATISGNTVTIRGAGSTIITASQQGDANRDAAISVLRTLTVSRADSLAVANGPYLVLSNQSISLNSGGSQPSGGATITDYSWDLNNDGTFGDATGATPPAISFATLTSTWDMVGGFNPISLRVTDSAGKISTASTTVEIVNSLIWDSNGATALRTDGSGDWTAADQWWNGTTNATWGSGDDAIFGNNGAGGAVTLPSPTRVNTLTFNAYTGTYTLGSGGSIITLKNGITKNATGTGAAAIISPIALGAAQTWANHSAGALAIGPDPVTNGGFLLTVGGTGNTAVSGNIEGAGGLTKTGAGILSLTGSNSYSGITTVSAGTLSFLNANTISAATSVAATGILRLGHATSMGTSTLGMASGATLQLRNDADTIFTTPISTPTGAVTFNIDVNNAGGTTTGKSLSLGNLTFATNTSGSVTNRINVSGGNGYTLRLGTLSSPSGGGSSHPLIINPTSAAVTISKVNAGSYGTTLNFTGSNNASLGQFSLGSNSNNAIQINGATVTLGTTSAFNDRSSGANSYTLSSGSLNLTTITSIANIKLSGTAITAAPSFVINGGTLNNTSGSSLNLGELVSASQNNNPTITIGGSFAFGTSSGNHTNNLNLGTGAVTNTGNRTITLNGTGTTLAMEGTMTNGLADNQTTTVNGAGNTLKLGAYNLSNSTTPRTGIFAGSGNVTIIGVVANSSEEAPASNLIYRGTGTLTLGGQNTLTGNTTVSSGTLAITSSGGIYTTGYTYTPTVTISSGATLQLAAWLYGLSGGLKNLDLSASRVTINGGTITYNGTGEGSGNQNNGRLFTIGTGGATLNAAGSGTWFIEPNSSYDASTGQVIPVGLTLTLAGTSNGRYGKFISGNGSLTKSGNGSWTLAGNNTYTGATSINAGTLIITGATQNTNAITFTGNSSLGLVIGAPVTASTAAVNFTNGRIAVIGTPSASSHVLLTALSFTGTPVLAGSVPGYELKVVGNQLLLNEIVVEPYDLWKTQITNGQNRPTDDPDGDGFSNREEFLFGTSPIVVEGSLKTVIPGTGTIVLRWLQRETGVTYTLRESDTLAAGSWSAVVSPSPVKDSDQTGAPSGYGFHSVILPTSGQGRFFIIEAMEE